MTGGTTALMTTVSATTWRTVGAVAVLVAMAVYLGVAAFKLSIGGSVAVYFVVWWTLLFAILPLRGRNDAAQDEPVAGQDPGAPARPRIREKAIWTTLLSNVVFLTAVAALPFAGL